MHAKDSFDIAVALTGRLLREQQMIFDRAVTGTRAATLISCFKQIAVDQTSS